MYSKIDILRFIKEKYGSGHNIPEIKRDILTENETKTLFSEYVTINDRRGFFKGICSLIYDEFQRWVQENNISQVPETTKKLENMIDTLEVYQKLENKEKDQITKFKKELCKRFIIEYRKRDDHEMVYKYTKLLKKLLTDY